MFGQGGDRQYATGQSIRRLEELIEIIMPNNLSGMWLAGIYKCQDKKAWFAIGLQMQHEFVVPSRINLRLFLCIIY